MATIDTELLRIVHFADLTKWSALDGVIGKIKSKFPLVPLSKILKRVKEPVNIEDNVLYKRITVRNNGRGVVQRDELLGSEIGTKRQFSAHAGQLIISRIDARNGAFGIVPDELEGAIVTNDFWLFEVQDALTEYLMLVLSSKLFQEHWQSQSSGTTNRQRIEENDFLDSKIALPSLKEQRNLIDEYRCSTDAVTAARITAKRVEDSIPEYLTSSLGISETRHPQSQGLFTVMFSELGKWGIDFLTSDRIEYDKKFPVKRIGDICSSGSGGTPARTISAYYKGNIPWVKTGEVQDEVIFDTEEKITQAAISNSSAKIYPKGSIVIAMYGQGLTRGRTAKLGVDAATNQACLVLYDINTDMVLPDYLWYYLQGEYQRIRCLAYGNNQPNLSADVINNYPIVIPPISSADATEVTQTSIVAEICRRKEMIKDLKEKAVKIETQSDQRFEEAIYQ